MRRWGAHVSVFCKDDATLRELLHFGMDFDSVFFVGWHFLFFSFLFPFSLWLTKSQYTLLWCLSFVIDCLIDWLLDWLIDWLITTLTLKQHWLDECLKNDFKRRNCDFRSHKRSQYRCYIYFISIDHVVASWMISYPKKTKPNQWAECVTKTWEAA